MSQPKNFPTGTITPTLTLTEGALDDACTGTAATTSTHASSAERPPEPTFSIQKPHTDRSDRSVASALCGFASAALSSSTSVSDSGGEWEEPHPGQRLVFLHPLRVGSCTCSSERNGCVAEVAVDRSSDGVCSEPDHEGRNVCCDSLSTGGFRNDTAAKGIDQPSSLLLSSSLISHGHRRLSLVSPWLSQRRSCSERSDENMQTMMVASTSAIATQLPASSSSCSSVSTGYDNDDDDDDDSNGNPLGFHIDSDAISEFAVSFLAGTDTTAATTLCGDERTIKSDDDASSMRDTLYSTQPLTDFSNFLGMQASVPPRSMTSQDDSSAICQTIGSMRYNNVDDTDGRCVNSPSCLSLATAVYHDGDDIYGWEAELEHRQSTSCSIATRPTTINDDDFRRSIKTKAESGGGGGGSSSSNSVISITSEREAIEHGQGETRIRQQSFFQRVFSSKSLTHNSGRDEQNAETPRSSFPTSTPAAGASSTATSLNDNLQPSSHAGPFPSVLQLANLFNNYTTMRDTNRL